MTLRRQLSERHDSVDCGSSTGPEELVSVVDSLFISRGIAQSLVREDQAGVEEGVQCKGADSSRRYFFVIIYILSFIYMHLGGCARLVRDIRLFGSCITCIIHLHDSMRW